MVWDTASGQVNVCKGLDWKRSLALHLWYACQPTAPIREVVGEFMQAFQVGFGSCREPLKKWVFTLIIHFSYCSAEKIIICLCTLGVHSEIRDS